MSDELHELQRHLREFENQFDTAQGNLRAAGSLWTLAGIGGLGGVLALDTSTLFAQNSFGIGQPALISFVCFLVIVGLNNLWSVDQFVYQRLLHAVYAFGMNLEDRLEPHERVRQVMYKLASDVTKRLSNFYLIPIVIYGLIFLGSNIAQMSEICSAPAPYGSILVNVLWLLFVVCVVQTVPHMTAASEDTVNAYKNKIVLIVAAMAPKP